MRSPSPFAAHRPLRLLGMLAVLALLVALFPALRADALPSASSWIRVTTATQGQLLSGLRAKLVSDYGQTAGEYDYSVVKKLSVSGTLSAQDYTDLRNAAYAGTSITELDLSGVVDSSTNVLSGMTGLTEVSLPPVGSYTLANPFQGNLSLRHVVVAAETYSFGSATTFNGITTLQRITFLHTTKPSMNASTFVGSNNADPAARTVVAVVPDEDRGDYDATAFQTSFAEVVESATAEDRDELGTVIEEASSIAETSAAAPFRWTLLQSAITAATAIRDNTSSTSASVYRARLVLQTAIARIGVADLGLSLKVTKGAEATLSWKNGTAQHYAEFTPHPIAKLEALSDGSHDIYVPTTTIPYVSQNVATAVIPGETDKVAKIFTTSAATINNQYSLNLEPLAGRQDTSLVIPGLGAGDNRGLYTNLGDTGVVTLDVGETFDLDTFRTQQAQLDQINNLFIEPDYTFDVAGSSITTSRVGLEGRRQLRIDAQQPGVSVVKISYGPLHYLTANDNGTPGNTNWSFNGIDPQNTGVAVVQVGDVGSFATGIDVKNDLDTFYFDKTLGTRDFTFTPAAGTTVRVHDPLNVSAWGSGWTSYAAAPDGSVTVKLKGGRNIVELTQGGQVQYRVIRAKGVDVAVTNTTDPGQSFSAGDVARIAVTGVEGGVEKLGGIYNPAFNVGTRGTVTYYDGSTPLVSNTAPQYQSATTTFTVNHTYTGTGDKVLNGDMFIGGLGAEYPYHRQIPLEGKPANLAAVAIGPYHFGGMPPVFVRGDQVSTTPPPTVPGVPTDVTLVPHRHSVDVSWTAPAGADTGVTGYRVRHSADGGQTWTTADFDNSTSARTVPDLAEDTTYQVQVAAVNDGVAGAFSATKVVKTVKVATVGSPVVEAISTSGATVVADIAAGDLAQSVTVEYSTNADHSGFVSSAPVPLAAGGPAGSVEVPVTGLASHTTYHVRVVSTGSDDDVVTSDWVTFRTATVPASLGAVSVSGLGTRSASVSAVVTPGDLAQDVEVQYSPNADHSGAVTSSATTVPASAGATTVSTPLYGLAPGTEFGYRVVVTSSDGAVVAGSWTSFTTASPDAPAVTLAADASDVRVGDTVRLTWTVNNAEGLLAGGDWSGSKAVAGGFQDVVVGQPGDLTYSLTAVGEGGTTTASVHVTVTLPASALDVGTQTGPVRVGRRATLTVTGLASGEAYRISIAGITAGTGVAPPSGSFTRTVVVPAVLADGTVPVHVLGSVDDRAGTSSLRVVTAKALTVKLARVKVVAGKRQLVTVSGLAAFERVRITYRGALIATLTASAGGSVSRYFLVGDTPGSRTVRAYGITNDRAGARTFKVVAR